MPFMSGLPSGSRAGLNVGAGPGACPRTTPEPAHDPAATIIAAAAAQPIPRCFIDIPQWQPRRAALPGAARPGLRAIFRFAPQTAEVERPIHAVRAELAVV